MMKHRSVIYPVYIFCLLVFSGIALPETKKFDPGTLVSNFKVVSYVERDGVIVIKLIPSDQPDYETNLNRIPTFIVLGEDYDSLIKVVGEAGAHYNKLIKLPYPDKISGYINVAETARSKMKINDWRILNMKDVVYGRQNGEGGPGIVCSTFAKKNTEGYIIVSQCNSFYESDILELKKLLILVGKQ